MSPTLMTTRQVSHRNFCDEYGDSKMQEDTTVDSRVKSYVQMPPVKEENYTKL